MKIKTIAAQVGIFPAEYRMQTRGDRVIVRRPCVKWSGSSGALAHDIKVLSGDNATAAKAFFGAGVTVLAANNNAGALHLDDVIDGNRADGVHVTGPLA